MNNPATGQSNAAPNTTLKANIAQLLKLDCQHAEKLAAVLKAERQILQQRDQHQLATLIGEKEQLLAKLDQSAKLRSQWLQQLGFKPNAEAWQTLIEQQQDSALLETWKSLSSAVRDCRELNEVNGRLIGRSQQTLTKLLNIMRGTSASPQLYGSDGNTQNRSESRCFTQA